LGDFRGTIDVEGEFKGLFFDEDHRGGMEAAAVETGFTGDSVVIDFGGAVLEIFVVFIDLNEAEIAAQAGKIPGLSFFAELFFTLICNLVEGEVTLSEPETDLVQFFLSEVGHGGPVSFFSEVSVHFVFLSFLCFLVVVSYLQLSAKLFGGSGLRIAKMRQMRTGPSVSR